MNTQHRGPLLACVVLTLACGLFLGNALRTQGLLDVVTVTQRYATQATASVAVPVRLDLDLSGEGEAAASPAAPAVRPSPVPTPSPVTRSAPVRVTAAVTGRGDARPVSKPATPKSPQKSSGASKATHAPQQAQKAPRGAQ